MSPAEAWDVLAGIAHGKAVRIGKPLAERLLRDPSVHLVALAVTAILILLAAHSSGSARGTLIAAVLALVGLAECVRGWSSPFRLSLPGIFLNLAAFYLTFRPQVGV